MNRRGFLMGAGGILALAAAPAIVRADSLMRIIPARTIVYTFGQYGVESNDTGWYRQTVAGNYRNCEIRSGVICPSGDGWLPIWKPGTMPVEVPSPNGFTATAVIRA